MAIRFLSKARKKALAGTALLRLDFNTKDDWRMLTVLPTIKMLLRTSDRIVIISHRGRPNGLEKKLSLRQDATQLSRLIHRKVTFIDHFRFNEIRKTIEASPMGSVFLLENLRFLRGEEMNDLRLARNLASLADFYVNDAFAVSHRANASVSAITKFTSSYAGLEMEREIASLSRVMKRPTRPMVIILGGAKATDKLGVIKYFKNRTDSFLLGGGPANTLMFLNGVAVKDSIRDKDQNDLKKLKSVAGYRNVVLPKDLIWGGKKILDLGPKTIHDFIEKISTARTILWSGPVGLIENKIYARGSVALARAIGRNRRAFSVAGGGETVMFLKQYGLDKKFSFISTGGGAMVEFLAGKRLPGIVALNRS